MTAFWTEIKNCEYSSKDKNITVSQLRELLVKASPEIAAFLVFIGKLRTLVIKFQSYLTDKYLTKFCL